MAVQIMLKGGRLGMAVYKPVISDYYAPGGWVQITEEDGSYFDDKPVVTDPLHGMIVNFSHYTKGFVKKYHRPSMCPAVYVIDGIHSSEGRTFGSGSLVLDPEGYACAHGAPPESDCTFIWITNKAGDIEYLDEEQENAKGLEIKSVNAFSPEGWEQRDDGSEIKKAFTDPQTGASLSFLRLHPGYCQEKEAVVNTGLFVIRGELESDLFSLKENTMIWLPAGYRRRWQAGKQGCLLLKIGNQGF